MCLFNLSQIFCIVLVIGLITKVFVFKIKYLFILLEINMPYKITNNDYVSILKFYKINIPKSKRLLQKQAEHIMADKLCKCIKKIDKEHEAKSIGICTKTIFNSKGYSRGKFGCKNNKFVKFGKTLRQTNKVKNKTRKNKK